MAKLSGRLIAVLFSTLVFSEAVGAQVASRTSRIAVSNGTAFLSFADYSGILLDLKPLSGAAAIERAEILFEKNSNEVSYVVIRLRGPTTRNGGMHHCGAGEEENLVWIKASHAAVLDVRSVLYGSCAFTIEPMQPLAVTASGLRLDYISYSEGRKFHCTYDDRSPAKGLIVTSEGEGPRSRAEELVAALARGDWSEATRFVYLDKNTRARMGIANDAPVNEARPKVVAWFRRLYAAVRPGRVVSVKIDTRVPPRALVSYTHEDLDGFVMRYVNGDWYYVLE